MQSTSLQSLLHTSALRPGETDLYFTKNHHPLYETTSFVSNPVLQQHPHFGHFIECLDEWNRKVKDPRVRTTHGEKLKHEFIHSMMKHLAVQQPQCARASMDRMYAWLTANAPRPPIPRVKPRAEEAQHQEEWEIRRSYQSNLPSKINEYKRRWAVEPTPFRECSNDEDPVEAQRRREAAVYRRENIFIRRKRENAEMKARISQYRKNKQLIDKQHTFCLVEDFNETKVMHTPKPRLSQSLYRPYRHIQSNRINASLHIRRTLPSSPTTNTTMGFYRGPKTEIDEEISRMPRPSELSVVDGFGLMSNPFEVKMKRKRNLGRD